MLKCSKVKYFQKTSPSFQIRERSRVVHLKNENGIFKITKSRVGQREGKFHQTFACKFTLPKLVWSALIGRSIFPSYIILAVQT